MQGKTRRHSFIHSRYRRSDVGVSAGTHAHVGHEMHVASAHLGRRNSGSARNLLIGPPKRLTAKTNGVSACEFRV